MYRFSSFAELLRGVRAMQDTVNENGSDIFVGEDGEYFLEIQDRGEPCGGISPYARMLEFSEVVDRSLRPYIAEHCKKLTKGDALRLLLS